MMDVIAYSCGLIFAAWLTVWICIACIVETDWPQWAIIAWPLYGLIKIYQGFMSELLPGCRSCHSPLKLAAKYCPKCGKKT